MEQEDEHETKLSLFMLPKDVLILLFSWFDAKELVKLSLVSKAFYLLANESVVWQKLVQRTLGDITTLLKRDEVEEQCFTWKQKYRLVIEGRMWNPNRRSPNLQLEKNLRTIRHSNPSYYCNESIQTLRGYSTGIHYFEIFVERGSESMVIGFASKEFNVEATQLCVGATPDSYGLTGMGGTWTRARYIFDPRKHYTSGDHLGLLLDLDHGEIIIFRNGRFSIEMLMTLQCNSSTEYYLTASLHSTTDNLTLLPTAAIPWQVRNWLQENKDHWNL